MMRPVPRMPEAETLALQTAYAEADCILEYGAGGSTVIAAEMPGKRVFAVESDAEWLVKLRLWFTENPPLADVTLHQVDIGPTKEWGFPKDEKSFRKWPDYPNAIWDEPGFQHPNVVLIDGRFRLACLLTTMLRITKPVVVLFDDYTERPVYHEVETLQKPSVIIGRMACFELEPRPFPVDRMSWIVGSYLRAF